MIERLILTLFVGFAGALIARRIHMPGAFMTGSMIAVMIFNCITEVAYCPTAAKPFVQLIAGAFIAFGIDRAALRNMKRIIKPLLAFLSVLLVWSLFCGWMMTQLHILTPVTAFLSCVPGGLTDISLLSIDMGANTPQVTVLQTLRMITAVGVFPILIQCYVKRFGNRFPVANEAENHSEKTSRSITTSGAAITLVVACIGGATGYILDFPAGTLTGAMISTTIYNVFTGKAGLPIGFRRFTQLIAGAMIGAMVSRTELLSMVHLALPFALIIMEYSILDFVIAPCLARLFHVDLLTMMLACTPAGAADMALIAGDMGGKTSDVAIFHVLRLCMVLTLFPPLILFIT